MEESKNDEEVEVEELEASRESSEGGDTFAGVTRSAMAMASTWGGGVQSSLTRRRLLLADAAPLVAGTVCTSFPDWCV
jgi:hypothetical protein